MKLNHLVLLICLFCGFLTNCTTSKPYENTGATIAAAEKNINHKSPNQISSWENSGAIAARTSNKSWSASYNWRQQGKNIYQINLFGPFGNGSAIIERTGNVTTYSNGGKIYASHNADQLLQQHTGVALPVNNLYYWVRGLPAPGSIQSSTRNPEDQLISLHQSGYIIEYTNYASIHGILLPTQIKLRGKNVIMKIVIKHWSF